MARELGDRRSIANAVGNRGIIHSDRGEYEQAVACFAEQEAMARELGDRSTIARAVGSRGFVHWSRGEYEQALACYAEATATSRQIGDHYSLVVWLAGTARTLLECLGFEAMPEYLEREIGPLAENWR